MFGFVILDTLAMYWVITMLWDERPNKLVSSSGGLLISICFALAMAACFDFLGPILSLAALLPLVILFGVILSALFGMSRNHAILGSAILLVYKVLFAVAFAPLTALFA